MTSAETPEVDPENGTLHVDGTRDSSEVVAATAESIETTAVDNNVNPMPPPPCE